MMISYQLAQRSVVLSTTYAVWPTVWWDSTCAALSDLAMPLFTQWLALMVTYWLHRFSRILSTAHVRSVSGCVFSCLFLNISLQYPVPNKSPSAGRAIVVCQIFLYFITHLSIFVWTHLVVIISRFLSFLDPPVAISTLWVGAKACFRWYGLSVVVATTCAETCFPQLWP